eukprot:gnl/TRDRNA2_/TRDRNA2_85789_c0_seq1.p1 gnl/TRDRNA2_/TRDRNA2_85789_c0~~gnl/TRDRNA2_/TRDRNA2_85789_c0_seq1.p1  ORF type:complete len:544 (+),score=85.93 gnl/TRDRNA2_/TRDRNA2_85789_c0_seq1:99-1634(+)
MGAVEPINEALGRKFNMIQSQRTSLPALIYLGSALGVAVTGPLCDILGRKPILLLSNIVITVSLFITALAPMNIGSETIIALRFISGFAGGIGGPAACVLAAESVPTKYRASLMYGLFALSSCGYLITGFGLQLFMPHFGEDNDDNWRGFLMFQATPALISVPLVTFLLVESPSFSAVRGNTAACMKSLTYIAKANGQLSAVETVRLPNPNSGTMTLSGYYDIFRATLGVLWTSIGLILALTFIEGAKSFMLSGSSYLWPQLFEMVHDKAGISPATLYSFAGFSPFIGLAVGERITDKIGGTWTMCLFAGISSFSLLILMINGVRDEPVTLFLFIVITKVCYGPLSVVVTLMKVESFNTDIRASAFAAISLLAKSGTIAAPTIAESMKGKDWNTSSLQTYLLILVIDMLMCACVSCMVPGRQAIEAKAKEALRDYTAREKTDVETEEAPTGNYGAVDKEPHALAHPPEPSRTVNIWATPRSVASNTTADLRSELADTARLRSSLDGGVPEC